MFCHNCACELPTVAKFCVRCGSRVEGPATAHATLGSSCVNCGKPYDPSHEFCNYCGHPVSHAQTQGAPTDPPSMTDTETTEFEKYAENYSRMLGDELVRLSADISQLKQAAQRALASEISRRGLKDQPPIAEEKKQYQGVGGWLTLFILGLTVFGPILTIVNLFKEFDQFAHQAATSNAVLAGLIFDIVFTVALMSFGVYAGVRLLKVKPNAVRIAKRYLVLYFLYSVLMIALQIFGSIANPPQAEQVTSEISPPLRSIIYVIIWYSYLGKSKRVAATYPVIEDWRTRGDSFGSPPPRPPTIAPK